MKLCCYFNYAPLYREEIFKAIDEAFDAQFLFGMEVEFCEKSGIAKLDYSKLRRAPIEYEHKILLKRFLWSTKLVKQAFKPYDAYLLTAITSLSYLPFIILAKLMGKKVYGWGHGPSVKRGVFARFQWMLFKMFDGFFVYNEERKRFMTDLGYDPKKIHVIYNSLSRRIDPESQISLKSDIFRTHFGNEHPVIMFTGRLTPQKRLEWLVDLVADLQKNGVGCNLLIVGDGPMRESLNARIKERGIEESTWVYGECYDDKKLSSLFYNADLCVSPGNVGLTALHAMTYGVPVISNDDGSTQMPEYATIARGLTGDLFKKDDYPDFYRCVEIWLADNKERREEIRANCQQMINEKWNVDSQIEVLKTHLKK